MIYIVYEYYFPAYKAGGPTQSLINLVKQIDKEVDIKIVCSNKDLNNTALPVNVDRWERTAAGEVFYSSGGFRSYKGAISKSDTVLFINGIFSFQYNFLPILFLSGRKIVSARGMLHKQALAQKSLKKRLYLFAWKMLQLHKKCEFHATSQTELLEIEATFGKKNKIWVIPNLPRNFSYAVPPSKEKGHLTLGTVALISPMKNHLLILRSLQLCKSNVVYNIYGPVKDEAYWNECIGLIRSLPANIAVNYHGDVPSDSVKETLKGMHIYIQPSKSENFGHSIYEALSAGRPVITSQNTPWNELKLEKAGLNINPENIAELAETIELFASMDNENYLQWSKSAKEYSVRHYDTTLNRKYIEMLGGGEKGNYN